MVLLLGLPGLAWVLLWLWDHRALRRTSPGRFWVVSGALLASALGLGLLLARDLVLQKVAGLLVMPAGLVWSLTGALSVHLFRAHRADPTRTSRRHALAVSLVFVLWTFAGSPYLGTAWLRSLESAIPKQRLDSMEPLDVVFVLGGGTKRTTFGRTELSSSGDRIMTAARLFHLAKTSTIVTSGRGIRGLSDARNFAEEGAALLMSVGVPSASIVRLTKPRNTSEELEAYRDYLAAHPLPEGGRAGVISSAWHLPRILRSAERQGLALVPIAGDHRGGTLPWASPLLVPQDWGFSAMQTAAWETVGRWVGR